MACFSMFSKKQEDMNSFIILKSQVYFWDFSGTPFSIFQVPYLTFLVLVLILLKIAYSNN